MTLRGGYLGPGAAAGSEFDLGQRGHPTLLADVLIAADRGFKAR